MTPVNIQSGFQVGGIYPLNRNVFGDDEFLLGAATDRPDPSVELASAMIRSTETPCSSVDVTTAVASQTAIQTHEIPVPSTIVLIGLLTAYARHLCHRRSSHRCQVLHHCRCILSGQYQRQDHV